MHARRAAKPQHFDDVDCRARVDRCVREPDASAYSERRCARAREPGWRARVACRCERRPTDVRRAPPKRGRPLGSTRINAPT
ncbi:ribosomal-protein-alanine acetyltransferase [Burkholderia pseudomallei 1710a]|uniref:Ribosomal-protein-alanine acetyltransferase n=1 Tax=Burkholderia pseudomallei 1710a TaxID=320371 RepID=A0A0E1W861_BURPE|nr:ribosomal-protein-alanine acetyltransferase [Burkholderia pseudomallei 1710a]